MPLNPCFYLQHFSITLNGKALKNIFYIIGNKVMHEGIKVFFITLIFHQAEIHDIMFMLLMILVYKSWVDDERSVSAVLYNEASLFLFDNSETHAVVCMWGIVIVYFDCKLIQYVSIERLHRSMKVFPKEGAIVKFCFLFLLNRRIFTKLYFCFFVLIVEPLLSWRL